MMMRFIRFFKPPRAWRLPVMIIMGTLIGFVLLLIYISKAGSYLTNDPGACVNCHIMSPYYATWNHSSHREVATCNDCHVPHNNFLNAYYFKAKDGLRHATIFTMRNEPQVIFILEAGRTVVQQNCERCHEHLLGSIEPAGECKEEEETERLCWECHREVPHGRVNSLSSVPNARIPLPGSPVPSWMKEIVNKK